ncbi:MAG: ferrous iron transport protein A [Deltaproteobacteria bacterium]|nr:ferrous iron transport protein A [Deltaproteobacteria bacterium]
MKLDLNKGPRLNLLGCRPGDWVRIVSIDAGAGAALNLSRLGLSPGDQVQVLRRSPLAGPIVVRLGESEIAIGRGLAERVLVERAPA